MRGEWRSARAMCGALCVMTYGAVLMPLWCVDNYDIPFKVRDWFKFNCVEYEFYRMKAKTQGICKLNILICVMHPGKC